MLIKSLRLTNFRHFRHLDVGFHLQDDATSVAPFGNLTVFVAPNGAGKSSILDGLCIALGGFIGKMPDSSRMPFRVSDLRLSQNDYHQNVVSPNVSVSIDALLGVGDEPRMLYSDLSCEMRSTSKGHGTSYGKSKGLREFAERVLAVCEEESATTTLPLVAYYGDSRLWGDNVLTKGYLKAMLTRGRKYAYVDSMNPKSGYKEFSRWYSHLYETLSQLHAQQRENSVGYDANLHELCETYVGVVNRAIEKALEITGWNHVWYSVAERQIYVVRARREDDPCAERADCVPLSSLSAGIKAVLGVVADLAYRCCQLNPHLGVGAAKLTPGVVLIDEIELHLHPAWQQQILPILQNLFCGVQFIVTTHSPQVVSSVPRECVRVIDGEVVSQIVTPTRGVDIDDILRSVFGTDPLFPGMEMTEKLRRFIAMASDLSVPDEQWQSDLQSLRSYFGETYGPLVGAVAHREYVLSLSGR